MQKTRQIFCMKGNYNTRYCDHIQPGETKTCQEIAAKENYKEKVASDPAIAIYNRYYKRYAARVKVRQIKEEAFKSWKYQAITKRDDCSQGIITPEEYTEWMEMPFRTVKRKNRMHTKNLLQDPHLTGCGSYRRFALVVIKYQNNLRCIKNVSN